MNRKKQNPRSTIILMTTIVVFLVAGYFYLKNKTEQSGDKVPLTETNRLISKDLEGEYPQKPREVLELYGRMVKCFYNESLSEEDFEKLVDQIRLLFDEELLSENTREDYVENLKGEIKEFKDDKKRIVTNVVEKEDQVKYYEKEGEDYVLVLAHFTIKEKSDYSKTYEQFILRKDKDSKWKLLGWKVVNPPKTKGE